MKYLITGGTGFIGNNLVRKLISKEDKLGLLIRRNSNLELIKDLFGKVDFLQGNLTNTKGLKKIIQEYKPDFIYHLGTYGNFPLFQKDVKKMILVNIGGTLNLLKASKGIPIINFGSSSEYGIKDQIMKENDTCNPDNWYGKTKLIQTLYCKEHNIPTLRIFSAYGPGQKSTQLIPTLINAKLTGKELHLIDGVRDYIYIEDIIKATLKVSENYSRVKGEIINLGNGKQYSTKEILNKLNCIDSKELKTHWDFKAVQTEPKMWIADISKAKELLNWEPKINLEEGLKKTYKWFKSHKFGD